jgi:MFS family permease
VFAEEHNISPNLTFYTLAILNAASVFGRITPNFLADFLGPLLLLSTMTLCAGVISFATFGAASSGGLIIVAILYGFFSGAYVSLLSPALISMAKSHHEIGIRLGLAFLVVSLAALTGTPINGALLEKYGFYAPIIFSGVAMMTGTALLFAATVFQSRRKGTWKV